MLCALVRGREVETQGKARVCRDDGGGNQRARHTLLPHTPKPPLPMSRCTGARAVPSGASSMHTPLNTAHER